MAKINLLPWREWERERKKNKFLIQLGIVVVFALVLVMGAGVFLEGLIENQQDRNRYVQSRIDVVNERISEISKLREEREIMLSRMRVIQELQGNRPIIVRLFDELARKLSDRVFFQSVSLVGNAISIEGVAESNNRISSQLRNFDESVWFTTPNVTAIIADTTFGPQASRFSLNVLKATPVKEEE